MPISTPEYNLYNWSDLNFPTIEPSLRLDFANARALDSRITFTRASVATYVGKDRLIKTAGVNEPRFDHDPATGESLGLLIEEERTNNITQSNASNWSNTNVTRGTNTSQDVSPEGLNTATIISETTGSGLHRIKSPNISFSDTRTFSIWIKRNSGTRDLYLNANAIMGAGLNFDFDTETLGSTTGTASFERYPNQWYRFILTGNGTGNTNGVYLQFTQSGNEGDDNYVGDTSNKFLVWGAQLEVGSFVTSHIPTSGSTATREKEFPAIETSSIDFKDFTQGGEGTLVCEFSNAGSTGSDIAVSFSGDTHNGATFVGLGTNSNRNAFNRVRVDATNTVLSTDTNFTTTGFYKVAFGIGQSRCTLAVRGSSSGVLEDTSVSYDSTPYTKLILGCDQTSSSSNNMISGTIKSVFYYPTLLSDTQLQTLTQ